VADAVLSDRPLVIARAVLAPEGFALAAAGLSPALLLGAFAFEVFGNYPPCPMCVTQRWIHAGVIAAGLGAFALLRFTSERPLRALAPLAPGAVLMASAVYAGRHAAVEYGFIETGCSSGGVGPDSLDALMSGLERAQNVVLCDEAAWSLLGISMAGYNALISLAAAGLSAYVGWRAFKGDAA
jgi:disulfide bond formation protein DsbB